MIKLGIVGITGRMGTSVLSCLKDTAHMTLEHVYVRDRNVIIQGLPSHTKKETDVRTFLKGLDVVIDFSSPTVSLHLLEAAQDIPTPLVICTTGHEDVFLQRVHEASQHSPLLVAPNTSLGIAVMELLLEKAAPLLKAYDTTLYEAHHIHKKDTPSGTAKSLIKALGGATLQDKKIAISCVRAGGILGDHEVSFVGQEEMLTLSHRCLNRDLFARGALQGAAFLASRPPGLYTMGDVLQGRI